MVPRDRSLIRLGFALLAVGLLAGCLSAPPRPAPPGPLPNAPSSTGAAPAAPGPQAPAERPPRPPRENYLSPASRSLVAQAHTQLARGDADGASFTLDRALRIEPSNPLLWIELARLRLAESDPHQAEGCARKALALAGGDRAAQAQAGRVLIDALRAQGRNQEAQQIEGQPFMQ
jgi:tetratricopeptide (TPR) repeat protein